MKKVYLNTVEQVIGDLKDGKEIYLENEPLSIEIGKLYKTRIGKKAFCVNIDYALKRDPFICCCVIAGELGAKYYTRAGRWGAKKSEWDIVSEWED